MRLDVFLGKSRVGALETTANESFFGFTYDKEYLASPKPVPLSVSLPLTESRYPGILAQPYFEGLLPEGESRDAIARRLGIPSTSSVRLLGALGRDCVGDVSIVEEGLAIDIDRNRNPGSLIQTHYPLKGGLLAIAENPRVEIPRLQEDMRLSLAGGQEKIALYHKQGDSIEDGWFVPMLGLPTTHIIKPGVLEAQYPQIALNEFLCLRAAAACGISTVDAYILFPDSPTIVIRRYDRTVGAIMANGLNDVGRIHQEDCCQACGIITRNKYEHDGGPGFKLIRDLLAKHGRRPAEDIATLIKWGIFNYLAGNCDAHAKNLSILHNADGTVSLAPAYDIISTAIYDGRYGAKLSRNMGMKIGAHENIDKVVKDDFPMFACDVHVRLQQVKSIGEELLQKLPGAFEEACFSAVNEGFTDAPRIAEHIMDGCKKRARVLP